MHPGLHGNRIRSVLPVLNFQTMQTHCCALTEPVRQTTIIITTIRSFTSTDVCWNLNWQLVFLSYSSATMSSVIISFNRKSPSGMSFM